MRLAVFDFFALDGRVVEQILSNLRFISLKLSLVPVGKGKQLGSFD